MTWRVGLLIPSSNAVMEVDCYRSLPHDATLHTSRMHVADGEIDFQMDDEMLDRVFIPAANALASVDPHIVVFDCPESTVECWLADRIGDLTGAVPLGVRTAVHQSLRDVQASRLVVVTPFGEAMNRRVQADLESEGLTVSAIHSMGLSGFETAAVTSDAVYAFVQASVGPRLRGDALLIAGTNVRAMSALSLLKISYDVPIVTSNLAVLQAVKREIEHLRQRELSRLSS
jgi:maleate isomerase